MKAIKGHYDGHVVVLDEPAPVDSVVEVVVQFPDDPPGARTGTPSPRKWHWEESSALLGDPGTCVSDEVLQQRGREAVSVAGLPPVPGAEEWERRVERLESMLDEWASDESGYDEEAWPELKDALERNRNASGQYRKLFRE